MRFISSLPRVTVSRIKPQPRLKKLSSIKPIDNTLVGQRDTRLLSQKVTTTGARNTIEANASNAANVLKSCMGRSSLTSTMMVRSMRKPSRKVFNLLTEPEGRSL
jgi:hypothetical protein